jgi:glycosyltransferase involved in cell wall biosynthesis
MKLLFLESYFGGSHGEFAKGLVEHSRYDIDLMTMPERNWRWRMRGAALHFYCSIKNLKEYDGLIVTDLMSLSDFKALAGNDCPPVLAYFHEDQITYPGVPGENNDFNFGIIDITTALSADKNLFNSKMHLEAFLSGIEQFAGRVPDFQPSWIRNTIAAKSDYLHPGVRFPDKIDLCERDDTLPPLIIWNHRWGYDKNAKAFFAAMDNALSKGLEFRLAILGDNFTVEQEDFSEAKKRYGDRIVRFGYVPERKDYIAWLKKGDIVISTALQENFGIAVVEAIRYGCLPLLPDRLSYPEILPDIFHPDFLYKNRNDMDQKLADMIVNKHDFGKKRRELSDSMGRFAWENMIAEYDKEFENLFKDAY